MPMSVPPAFLAARLVRVLFAATLLAAAAAPAHAERVGGGYHVMRSPEQARAAGRTPPAALAAGLMKYYGGTVFSAVKVVSVIWGPSVDPVTVAGVPGFSAALVDSTFVDQMAQYDTHRKAVDGRPGTRQSIGRGSYLGQFQIAPYNTATSITDADVQVELKAQIKAGHLPARDAGTLYMVYFPASVTIELDGMLSCQSYLAYHFATVDTQLTRKNLFYSVEPDCGGGFTDITFAASHEFAEAVTDNIPTPGTSPAFPQSWNTVNGYEIADLCGGGALLTAGPASYTVTQVFLNSTGRCSTGNYTSP
jgi:hypothetical protein